MVSCPVPHLVAQNVNSKDLYNHIKDTSRAYQNG
jgi:hypothetical protein